MTSRQLREPSYDVGSGDLEGIEEEADKSKVLFQAAVWSLVALAFCVLMVSLSSVVGGWPDAPAAVALREPPVEATATGQGREEVRGARGGEASGGDGESRSLLRQASP